MGDAIVLNGRAVSLSRWCERVYTGVYSARRVGNNGDVLWACQFTFRFTAHRCLVYFPVHVVQECIELYLTQALFVFTFLLKPGTPWTGWTHGKMKSAGRRGNIGPSAGLVILKLTEPADRPAVARPMLRFFEHTAGRFHNLSDVNLNSN